MKYLFFVFLLSALTWGMDKKQFDKEAERQAKYFGYLTESHYYTAVLVDLPFLKTITQESALAASRWSSDPHFFQMWVLSDKGLDELADEEKLPHLTAGEKTEVQRKAIVHEFVHGWGVQEESITTAMTGLIMGKGALDQNAPARWLAVFKEQQKQKIKVEERAQ